MRDPACTHSWSDTFAFRFRYQELGDLPTKYETLSQSPVSGTIPAIADSSDIFDDFDFDLCPADYQVEDCEVMRLSTSSLGSLRSLPPTSLVLLLTPVLAPAHLDHSTLDSNTTDPFEAFGRELSKHHHRLRHVPYLPRIGMTDTHSAFIEQAAAVVVVICEPEDSDEQSISITTQQYFADAVLARREDLKNDDEQTPFVLVRFENTESEYIGDEYSNVLRAPAFTKQACTMAARLLFKTEI
ncbi:hypothetical protein MBLNU13_g11136t1 [Cladosporium sp. NU13]